MKYLNEFKEHFKDRTIFSINDVKLFLSQKKISKQYLYFLISYLLKKKVINRINKGIYSFKSDPVIIGFAFSPFYYGLHEALSFHGLWEQETNLVIITPRKIRPGSRTILNSKLIIRRINKRMFFGFDFFKYYDLWIPVSTIEKTLIDFVYFKERLPEEALIEIKKRINKKIVFEYLKKTPKSIKKRVSELLA